MIAAQIKAGAIGRLREIHNWSNRPVWPQYTEIPRDRPPLPKGFDWDLWLGPALDRPYHPHYTHTVFRGWYDFGGGSMADMGIYSLWPVFTALDLGAPLSAEASATPHLHDVDQVSRTGRRTIFPIPTPAPSASSSRPRGEASLGTVLVRRRDETPTARGTLEAQNVELPREGILFVGDQGSVMAGFQGQDPRLFAHGTVEAVGHRSPAARRPRTTQRRRTLCGLDSGRPRGGRNRPAVSSTRGRFPTPSTWGPSRCAGGKKVLFDSATMRITNVADANKYLYREYRKGWEL